MTMSKADGGVQQQQQQQHLGTEEEGKENVEKLTTVCRASDAAAVARGNWRR